MSKYVVKDKHGNVLLGKITSSLIPSSKKVGDIINLINLQVGEEATYILTEQEIKDFDENYMAFAKERKS